MRRGAARQQRRSCREVRRHAPGKGHGEGEGEGEGTGEGTGTGDGGFGAQPFTRRNASAAQATEAAAALSAGSGMTEATSGSGFLGDLTQMPCPNWDHRSGDLPKRGLA